MKNKYIVIFCVMILSLVFLFGCSASNNTTEQIYGEVTEISNDSITVEIGTMKEREKPEDGEKDFSEKGQGKAPSMLELSGETKEISITKDTVIKRQSRGHAPGENGVMEEDSDKTDKTDGENEQTQEEAAFEDISEGDTLQITLDSSGKASEIIILSSGMRGGQREESQSEV